MRNAILIVALLSGPQAVAGESIRCGTDDFGNTVCMDGNGEVTTVPAASAVTPTASIKDDGRRTRCGVDPFGNKVCR